MDTHDFNRPTPPAALLTRVAFIEHIEHELVPFVDGAYTIGYLHLSGLRHLNRIEGIERGDEALQQIVVTIANVSPDALIARYTGNGFSFIIPTSAASSIARRVNDQLPDYAKAGGLVAKVGTIDCVRPLGPEECIERARFACETLRSAEGAYHRHFDEELKLVFDKRAYVVDHLDDAIARGEIRAWAQPIMRVLTGHVCEVEILARWESERYGFLRPDEFVPELERRALIHKLDLEVIRLACSQWCEAHAARSNVPFGINLSRLDFELCDIYANVRSIMHEYGVPVDQVHIEVTESSTARGDDVVAKGVRRFRDAGFTIYMDDFGTGYSSLGTMASLRFDVVKIDKTLVDNIESDERARSVLADTISMIKRLGMQTLCEGVENERQLQILRAIGCEKAQGYYFRKPIPHREVMETLNEWARNHERQLEEAYYNAIGRINLLDGTSIDTHGIEAATFLGHSPIAILEFNEGGIELLSCNFAYDRLLLRMGFTNLADFVEYTSRGAGRVNARALQAALKAKETGREQRFSFIVGKTFCTASLRLIAQTTGRDAYLNLVSSIENAPQVTEHTLLLGLLEGSDRNFFWKDSERRFLGANQSFLDYYGFTSLSEILGKTDEDMGWHDDEEPFRTDELRVLKGERVVEARGTCLCRGELRDIIASKRPLYSGGEIVGLVGYFDDIGPHREG